MDETDAKTPKLGGADLEDVSAFLGATLSRLEEAIDLETHILRSGDTAAGPDFSEIKTHGLLALTQAMRREPSTFASPHLARRMRRLRAKLDVNARLLLFHLEAVREVTALIAQAISDQNSDGTYSLTSHRARKKS